MLDFMIAKMNHQMWKRKLHKYIHEDAPIDEKELVSERDCQLGKWLYSEGIEKYRELMDIHSLESVHKQLHTLTHSIVNNKKGGNYVEAKTDLQKLSDISEEIVHLLDKLELKML